MLVSVGHYDTVWYYSSTTVKRRQELRHSIDMAASSNMISQLNSVRGSWEDQASCEVSIKLDSSSETHRYLHLFFTPLSTPHPDVRMKRALAQTSKIDTHRIIVNLIDSKRTAREACRTLP